MTEREIIKKCYDLLTHSDVTFHFQDFGVSSAIWTAPAFRNMRWDIFGVFDIVVCTVRGRTFFIQCTDITNLAARRKKIKAFFASSIGFAIPNSYVFAFDENKNTFVIEEIL